ncbi:MAG: glycosyltransferase, partial [Verrucomicrobiota bacterium]
ECRIIESPRANRAHQLNLGAKHTSSDWLVFLHADTRLMPESIEQIITLPNEIVGGGFERLFAPRSGFLDFTCRLATFRGITQGIFLGDQCLFVRRTIFEQIGGFSETIGSGEDLWFSLSMRECGKTKLLSGPILSSARRFEKPGAIRQTYRDLKFALAMIRKHRKARS